MKIFAYLEQRPERTRHLLGLDVEELTALIDYLQHPQQSWNRPEDEEKRLRAKGGGAKPKLSFQQEVELTLFVLRQGVSFEVAGLMYGLSTTQAHTIFHRWQVRLRECLPASLFEEYERLGLELEEPEEGEVWVVDSWEQPRQRPQEKLEQKKHYSGKKRQHTFKGQLFVPVEHSEIIDVIPSVRGPSSDITLFRQQKQRFSQEQEFLGDKAYVGDEQVLTPTKKPKGGELTSEQKQRNKEISAPRIVVEHMIRRLKIFRIVQQRFRHHPSKHGDFISVVCALVRIRLGTLNLTHFAQALWPSQEEIRESDGEVAKMAFAS